jgi:hypothetical protein
MKLQTKFPNLSASTLEQRSLNLPGDLEGELNILFIPFAQWHQLLVNAWLPLASGLEQHYAAVRYYELPVIQEMGAGYQEVINAGMRAGIPDAEARERTITLFVDKPSFLESLGLEREDAMYVLLVDRDGNVAWRGEGGPTPGNIAGLIKAVEGRLALRLPLHVNV